MELKYLRGASNILVTRKGREYFFRMFDSKLSPRDIKDMYSWQAVKKVKIDNEKSDDIIIKEHVRTYEGHFNDLGPGLPIETQDKIISKNGSLENGELQRRQKFSVKGKEVETGSDTLNSNKKRVALTQGNGKDSDSDSDSDNRL
ncbi:hypothetical protein GLOIN_2v1769241 [Rhizophagus irregularis DAOM 181602=DAOM 197198]|uniref:Uncharacterized protein n=1 Tax=Rhizophagus irregularis (strain DAOM 181602 / DAOM 197198 / MUCL 43194) TaxID=747089 RepID=A0A2P4QF02_RHIID|nr:hypothetical protein GLOIN_2v1769241 [Rhizophagus irregularis DAOM 181602=DAOM 197198]POG76222.1 hypothetical protein GLOIN_2v1769241 [Rhizophagus irregularis DAOM 181602=DAOM 197198]|eukprot:XP_025183088.1 hypothetical protein GLOIN_2v1769241 [Rhizophagus irregularis DAOM 181602=DAOM 197198]